jgi:adenylate cyclase
MFVDIRSFTARSAQQEPRRVVAILNEFLGTMVQVVEIEAGGMVNKFLGDGFMALFGVSTEAQTHADDALRAGRAMLRQLETLNRAFASRGEPPIAIGIGMNTGSAIVGSIGSPERMEFTVIGNAVNVASRIESLTKAVGHSLLLSETTWRALQKPVALRELAPQSVKGVEEPLRIFTVAD